MKKFYLFMMLMLTALTSAFAQAPTFTAEGASEADTHWYYIQFERTQKVLEAQADGNNARLAYPTADESQDNAMLWKLVGSQTDFKLISKTGLTLAINKSSNRHYMTELSDTKALSFKLVDRDGFYLIKDNNAGLPANRSWNMASGYTQLGYYNDGDPSNYLTFVPKDEMTDYTALPEIHSEYDANASVWYQIMFLNATRRGFQQTVVTASGEGNKCLQKLPITDLQDSNINSQLWQFVGADKEHVKLINKNGQYAYLQNTGNQRIGASKTETNQEFILRKFAPLHKFEKIWQLIVSGHQVNAHDRSLNPSGGVSPNGDVGQWNDNADDGALAFIPVTVPVLKKEAIQGIKWINFITDGTKADSKPMTLELVGATDGALFKTLNSEKGYFKKGFTNTEYTLRATALAGYKVLGFVLDGQFVAGTELTFQATEDLTSRLQIKYAKVEQVKVTLAQKTETPGGRLRFTSSDLYFAYEHNFPKGSEVTLITDTEDGYELKEVLVNGTNIYVKGQEIKFTVNEATKVKPVYEKLVVVKDFYLYVTPMEGGEVKVKDYTGEYVKKTDHYLVKLQDDKEYTLEVTPADGYAVESIPVRGVGDIKETMRFTPTATDTYLEVKFKQENVKKPIQGIKWINFITDGTKADSKPMDLTLVGATDGAQFKAMNSEKGYFRNGFTNTEYKLKATALSGYTVLGFVLDGKFIAGTELTFKATEDLTSRLQIKYAKVEQVKVTLAQKTETPGGRLRFTLTDLYSAYEHNFPKGSEVTLITDTEDGYELKEVLVNGTNIYVKGQEIKFTVNEATKVKPVYEKLVVVKDFYLYVTPMEGGEVKVKDYTGEYVKKTDHYLVKLQDDKEYTLEVTPAEGYAIESIPVRGVGDIKETMRFTPTATDTYLEVKFKQVVVKKEITIPTAKNGTVTLEGVKSGDKLAVGTEVMITATPEEGYELESITVGGKDVTEAKKFVVGDDNTIVVKFKKKTAIEDIEGVSYQVFPNPAVDFVELRGFTPDTEVRLITLTGQVVRVTKTSFDGSARLNVSDLPKGLYLIRSEKSVIKLQVI